MATQIDSAPPVEFKQLFDTPPAESICGLIYGAPGTGKTEFAASYGDRTLIIDIGKSKETLYGKGFQKRYGANPIVIDIEEKLAKGSFVPEKATAFDLISDTLDYALATPAIRDRFDLVVIDEATALRRVAMNKGLELAQKFKGSKGLANSKDAEAVLPDVGDYGAEMSLIEQFIAGYVDIMKANKKHFLVLAHERNIYGRPAKIGDPAPLMRTLPGFTGKTHPDALMAYFDLVWHTETAGSGENTMFRIRTMGDESLRAKTRYGGVFKTLEQNLNFPMVVERIRQAHAEVQKQTQINR